MSEKTESVKPWEMISPAGRMLRPNVVFERIGLSKSQVYEMIRQGEFPPFIKLGSRASAMPEDWLDAFITDRVKRTVEEMK